jgi:hypothetical protein
MDAAVEWAVFEAHVPVFAGRVRELLAAHPHHVLATLRSDGSPRVGGTNVFVTDGTLWVGMMPHAARVGDLRRDPRCAIHSAPLDEALTLGDVRLQLRAREVATEHAAAFLGPEHPGDGVVFTLTLVAVSLVRVAGEELVLETWRPGEEVRVRHVRD